MWTERAYFEIKLVKGYRLNILPPITQFNLLILEIRLSMKNRLKSLGQRTSKIPISLVFFSTFFFFLKRHLLSNKDLVVHDVLSFFVQYKADFL